MKWSEVKSETVNVYFALKRDFFFYTHDLYTHPEHRSHEWPHTFDLKQTFQNSHFLNWVALWETTCAGSPVCHSLFRSSVYRYFIGLSYLRSLSVKTYTTLNYICSFTLNPYIHRHGLTIEKYHLLIVCTCLLFKYILKYFSQQLKCIHAYHLL